MLADCNERGHAKGSHILDHNGRIVASGGSLGSIDADMLACLVAGSLATLTAIQKWIGHREVVLRSPTPSRDHLFLAAIAGVCMLVMVFDDATTPERILAAGAATIDPLTAVIESARD